MFAACMLTTTSILGTFFVTLPTVDKSTQRHDISRKTVVLADAMIHVIPLLVFLLGFNYFKTRLRGQIHMGKTLLLALVFSLIYGVYVEFENSYDFDHLSLGILCVAVFLASYNVYSQLILKK